MRPAILGLLLAGCPSEPGETDGVDTDAPVDTDDTDVSDTDAEADLVAAIEAPSDGEEVTLGDTVVLEGVATLGEPVEDVTFTWTSSLAGTLGTGASLAWTAEIAGTHTIELRVEGHDQEATDTIDLDVVSPEAGLTLYGADVGVPEHVDWYGLDVAADGRVLGATSVGLVVFDGASARKYGLAQGLPGDEVIAVMEDSFGEIWLGYQGFAAVDAQRVTLDSAGTLTVNAGVNVDRTGEVVEVHRFAEQAYGAGVGDVWMGSNEGLCVYDRDRDEVLEHLHPTHPHGRSRGVAITSDGHAWNGEEYQLSRWVYDNDGGISLLDDLVEYSRLWEGEPGVDPVLIRDLATSDLTVWVASEVYGLGRVDATLGTIDGFSRVGDDVVPSAFAVRVGLDGLVWIGGQEGLYVHDPDVDDTRRVGASYVTDTVQQLAVDEGSGTVWAATSSGLWRIVGLPE